MADCDTCLTILKAGLRSAHDKEEWLSGFNLHLSLAHGIRQAANGTTPVTREQLREFWRTFRFPENPNSVVRYHSQARELSSAESRNRDVMRGS